MAAAQLSAFLGDIHLLSTACFLPAVYLFNLFFQLAAHFALEVLGLDDACRYASGYEILLSSDD